MVPVGLTFGKTSFALPLQSWAVEVVLKGFAEKITPTTTNTKLTWPYGVIERVGNAHGNTYLPVAKCFSHKALPPHIV